MNPYWISITLRVSHPSKSAIEICTRLNLQPKHSWTVGCPKYTKSGEVLTPSAPNTYCCFNIPGLISGHIEELSPEGGGLNEKLRKAMEGLQDKRDFFREIVDTGGRNEFFVGCFLDRNAGEIFDWQVLSCMADLRINLALDMYPYIPNTENW